MGLVAIASSQQYDILNCWNGIMTCRSPVSAVGSWAQLVIAGLPGARRERRCPGAPDAGIFAPPVTGYSPIAVVFIGITYRWYGVNGSQSNVSMLPALQYIIRFFAFPHILGVAGSIDVCVAIGSFVRTSMDLPHRVFGPWPSHPLDIASLITVNVPRSRLSFEFLSRCQDDRRPAKGFIIGGLNTSRLSFHRRRFLLRISSAVMCQLFRRRPTAAKNHRVPQSLDCP